ncbi:MAG TPA: 8-oxo-dGTP diphosphatase [Candidatus Scybalomonas excrementigallinarum]|nr:8-oxo-dGTP diphosphatase [Candidatus Scybalomonas excrementigallinarum]
MRQTTLCYLEKDDCYLMLHRIYKKQDINKDKWIGVGGKFEYGEAPEECLLREVKEETGLTLLQYQLRGILTFVSDMQEPEYIFLYTSNQFEGTLKECEEGALTWVPKEKIEELNLWEGDKEMFRLLEEREQLFSLKLEYKGDSLIKVTELSPYKK